MIALLACPFCGGKPKHGLTKRGYCQLHGEPLQGYAVWCEGHARVEAPNKDAALRVWNTRADINPLG